MSPFTENVFILGGQFGSLARSFSKLIPPPDNLMEALEKHQVFPEAIKLLDQFEAGPTAARAKALSDCCNASRHLMAAAATGSEWDLVKLREIVSVPVPRLRASVESRLFNLPASTLVFEPTSSDPAFGWQQLRKFDCLFSCLPEATQDKFKPLHLTIRPIPPAATPAPSPAPTATPAATAP